MDSGDIISGRAQRVAARRAPMKSEGPLNTIVIDYTVFPIVLYYCSIFKREQQEVGFGVSH